MKKNWQIKKVEDCLEKIPSIGSVFSSQNLQSGKFPIIDQGQDFITGYTNNESLVFSDCLPVVIFGDHTRALKFIDFPFAVGADGTKILKPKTEFDPVFFYYMLKSLDLSSRGYARHFKLLKESEIPLPPLEIQKKIVKILDEKMGKIAEAKRLRESALADTEKILSQTLHEIFEEGKQKGWQTKTVESFCNLVRGSSPRPKSDPKYYGGNVPRLMVADLTRDGMYVTPQIDFLTPEGALKSRPMKEGDVVMAVSGQPGQPAILRIDACIHDGFVGFRNLLTNIIMPDYFYYYLLSTKIIHANEAVGAIFQNLKTDQIKKYEVVVPPILEQKAIVFQLDKLLIKIHELQRLQTSQLEDLKKLEKAYLREAFNGELK